MAGVYYVRKMCWNCGNTIRLEIPAGKTVQDFLDKNKCEICECDMRLNETSGGTK